MSRPLTDNQTQPIFDVQLSELTGGMLEDWLFGLDQTNKENMVAAASGCVGHFKDECFFGLITAICTELHQPREVRFAAAEIFDAFMVRHMDALRSHATASADNNTGRLAEWRKVKERVHHQLVLRMYSCVQIASKLHLHHGAVTIRAIEKCLARTEKAYGPRSILRSELRVLDTLGYRLDISHPLIFVEVLIGVLDRNRVANVPSGEVYQVAMEVLDALYLRRDHVFRALFSRITGQTEIASADLAQLDAAKNDSMFSACAVVACAVYTIDSTHFELIVNHLHDVTHVPAVDIMDLAIVLISMILYPCDDHVSEKGSC